MSLRSPLPLILTALLALATAATAQEITVHPGDTLWSLALRHDTTVDALMSANGLVNENLRPGMTLNLPNGSNVTPEVYVVGDGDTLYDIALAFDMSVDDLIAFNDLDGTVIRPGQELRVTQAAPEPKQIVVEVQPGDTLSEIASANGVSVSELMASNNLTSTNIRPGLELVIAATAAEPEDLIITVRPGDTLWDLARAYDSSSAAIARANDLSVDSTIRPGDTLAIPGRYASPAVDQGGAVPEKLVVQPGDTLWQIARNYDTSVAALMSANNLRTESITAGQVIEVVPGRELIRARPTSADPRPSDTNLMVWPIVGQITSRFGYRRLFAGSSNFHNGLDIDGVTGDPIRSATSGTVTFADWLGGFGKLVIVTNGDTEYYYAHASEILVYEGQQVGAGDTIALVGTTGVSTGSHLHFEIRVGGSPVDPLPILEARASR
jgi:murein DD-endopeptidase MepM/ murein hydrolase activator NlpD